MSTSPVKLAWLVAQCRFGDPVAVTEREVSPSAKDVGVCYELEVREGRRWVTAAVSKRRIDEVQLSIEHGKIEGSVWCFESDKEEARNKLVQGIKSGLESIQRRIQDSIDSIDPGLQNAPRP